MKIFDGKVWQDFQKNFKVSLDGLEKQVTALIGGIAVHKSSDFSKSETMGRGNKKSGQNFDSARTNTEKNLDKNIDRNWLLENVGRSNAEVQKFMVGINFLGANIRVNKLMAPYLIEAEARIKEAKIPFTCKQGETSCQNWRPVRGGTSLSMHSWGTAIDLNARENPWQPHLRGHDNGGKMVSNIPPEMVKIMKSVGFRWGGDWNGPADPMHFELAANPYTSQHLLQSSPAKQAAEKFLNA